ncbi:MAG TPA: RNA polymerase sigma factor [Puia sp.]|jgi:RNA polymerase sigma-70 factor (family 1)|nr:RNA polymerase sigma factor [Puia sp.]
MENKMYIAYGASDNPDETILLQRVSEGDWNAYTDLFNYYMPKLSAYIFPFTGQSVPDTEEIIQEVFLKIWEKRETLVVIRSFDSYLFRMAKNKLIDIIDQRRAMRKRDLHYTSLKEDATQTNPEEELHYQEYATIAQKAIDSLSPKLKSVFLLSTQEELSLDEIAQRLSIPKETVKKRLYLAGRSIKNFLKQNGDWIGILGILNILFQKL